MNVPQTLRHPALGAIASAVLLTLASAPAQATNGYFSHGYGLKAKGMGGAATAMAEDAFGGANNPASMVWAGSRLDAGLDVFMPKRDAERTGAGIASLNGKVTSRKTSFLVPEFGYNRMIDPSLSVGVSVYGNGGMNTTYPQGSFQCPTPAGAMAAGNMLCGGGELGVDLTQLVIAPTVSWKFDASNSVGASLLVGYQQFKAYGLQAFSGMSSDATALTNTGFDSASGVGVRIGYMGRLSNTLSVGVSYSSKISMGAFDKYKGLFAGAGDFDIPANYSIGLAFNPDPAWTIALDLQRIAYSGVASVGNASSLPNPLGSASGPGFGWKDVDVVKLGVSWKQSDALTLRAGYNHGTNPVTAANVSFNILAPGVMTDHFTGGFTYALDRSNEITGALMIAPRKTVTGASMFNATMGAGMGGNETVGMKQMTIGVAWGMKF